MATKPPTYAPRRATLPPTLTRNTDQSAMARALEQMPAAPTVPQMSEPSAQKQVSEYVVGQVYPVPLYRLARSENNARIFYSSEEIDETSKSLVSKGQEVPAIGYVRAGKVVLVDGQKRSQAATSAGIETLDVLIDPHAVGKRHALHDANGGRTSRWAKCPELGRRHAPRDQYLVGSNPQSGLER